MLRKDLGWWHDFFPDFRAVFDIVPKKFSNAQAQYVIKKLRLKPGKRFLDCPCGIGRISIPIARKGIEVTAVDIVQPYLDELNKKANRLNLKIDTVCSDMRQINFDSRYDAGANIWTSFGFFEKESDNLLVLKKMYNALKPGGKFMLHLINRDWIMANYASRSWFELKNPRGLSIGKVIEERKFDYDKSINYGTWTFVRNGEEKTHEVNIRMYSYHELVAMFKKVGFIDIEGYGSIKDEPIDRDKRMMFIIGTRPKRR